MPQAIGGDIEPIRMASLMQLASNGASYVMLHLVKIGGDAIHGVILACSKGVERDQGQ